MKEQTQSLHLAGNLYTHLLTRHVNFNLHCVWLNEQEQVATFPLYNLAGRLLGYQQYRPKGSKAVNNNPYEGKYFTKKLCNAEPSYWGVESWSCSNTLFLVEGLFDAARLTSLGYAAFATFTNNPGDVFASFMKLVRQVRPVVALCDADAAGKQLAKYAHKYCTLTTGKDVSEAQQQEVINLVTYYDNL